MNGVRGAWGWAVENPRRIFAEAKSIAQYTSLREDWATVPLDRQNKKPQSGAMFVNRPGENQEQKQMHISTAQVKEIRDELAKLKPVKVILDGNRNLTVKEAVFALAPTLERMKKRGFDTQEIADKLHEKGIEVKPPTLAKYLNEFRRGKERKADAPPPLEKTVPVMEKQDGQDKNTQVAPPPPIRKPSVVESIYTVTPDIPLDEL